MHRFGLLLLCVFVACSGRSVPESGDGGVGASDGGVVLDASSAPDAGPCVSADNPCNNESSPSSSAPCLPWEDWCTGVRTCEDDTPYWCRVLNSCLALPNCGAGESESNTPCGLDEADCRTETMCGVAVHCRAPRNCEGGSAGACPPNSVGTAQPCGLDEPDCNPIYGCNSEGASTAQWCRVVPGCDGVPSCTRGFATSYPCVEGDRYCERVTVCGQSIFCHF